MACRLHIQSMPSCIPALKYERLREAISIAPLNAVPDKHFVREVVGIELAVLKLTGLIPYTETMAHTIGNLCQTKEKGPELGLLWR